MNLQSLRMPRRFLRGSALRLLLTVAALASGVALVCAVNLANRAVYEAFVGVVDTMAGRASLQVGAGAGGLMPEGVASKVAAVPGVELAVPVVSATAFLTDGSGQQLAVHGIDVTDDGAVRVYEPVGSAGQIVDDPLVFLNRPDSIVLTEEFAMRRGLEVDDTIDLLTPAGRRRFTVRGLLAPRGVAQVHGGHLAVMDIQAAEQTFTRPGWISRVDVVVRPKADVAAVRDSVAAALPPGLRIETPAQRQLDLQAVMRATQTLLTATSLLGIVAAFLIVYSRLTTVFEARTGQLAIVRAVGVRAPRVWWELTKEAAVIGVAGVAAGIPLGIGLAQVLLPLISAATSLSAKLIATETAVAVRAAPLLLAGLLGLGTVILAAALPAWRVSHVSVAETLSQRGVEQAGRVGRSSWIPRAFVAALTVLLVVAHLVTGDPASGLVASALIVVCAVLVTRSFLAAMADVLTFAIPRFWGPSGWLALAALSRNPRRTALAVATLGVGFGTVLWLWTVATSFERSVLEALPAKMRGDLSVGSANLDAGYVEAPLTGDLVGALAAVPGVAAAVGERAIDWHYGGGPIAVDAFDPGYFTDSRFGEATLVGRYLPDALGAVARGEAAVVSENFVRNLGLGVGDELTLDTPSGPLTMRIAGVWRDFLSPRGTVNLSRTVYRAWWRDDHVVRGLIAVDPGTPLSEVRTAIGAALGERYGLRILTIGEFVDWLTGQVRRAFNALHLLAGLVLVVVTVGVGDTLAAGMLERTRELGMARAVGVRRGALGRAVLVEAALLGLLGFALASVVGLALGMLWTTSTFPSLLGWTLTLHVPLHALLGLAAVVIATCLAAAYLPARRALHVNPVVALRTE